MSYSSFTLLGALSVVLMKKVFAFTCVINGNSVSCPTVSDDLDKSWCCPEHCCDFDEYSKEYPGFPVGIIILFWVVVSVVFIYICCRYQARRRAKRSFLNSLVAQQITPIPCTPGPQVHLPSVTDAHNYHHAYTNTPSPHDPPPPYNVATNYAQPPLNPYYGSIERSFPQSKS